MTHRFVSTHRLPDAPSPDGLIFPGVTGLLLATIVTGALPAFTGAMLVLGWCLLLCAQALYAGLALNTGRAGETMNTRVPVPVNAGAGHLAGVLETGRDADHHYRRLRMTTGALNAGNAAVMAAAAITGWAVSGPLSGLVGAAFVFALAVHSYSRAIRYSIWGLGVFVLGYALQLTLTVEAPVMAGLGTQSAVVPYIALTLSGLVSAIAYSITIIANLRHIAALAFTHAGICAALVIGTAQPAITNLALASLFLFAPGLCALSAKTRRHCRHRLYGEGERI